MEGIDIQAIVRQAVQEFVSSEQAKSEPAYKAELLEERKRREQLERRVNELVEENKRSRKMAEEAERELGGPGGVAAAGRGQDRPGVQGGAGRDRADRGRAAGGARRSRRNAVEGVPDRVRERESGVSAGADCRGDGDDGDPKAPAAGRETVDLERIRPG